jgi:hypothetical protein
MVWCLVKAQGQLYLLPFQTRDVKHGMETHKEHLQIPHENSFYILTITNMATLQNFEVVYNKLNIVGMYKGKGKSKVVPVLNQVSHHEDIWCSGST